MSTYNQNKLAYDYLENNKDSQDYLKLRSLCKAYTEHFPERKIYITKKLGKRLSYLTGSGNELYLKPVKIPVGGKYTLFIESSNELSSQEIKTVKELFTRILNKEQDSSERQVDSLE